MNHTENLNKDDAVYDLTVSIVIFDSEPELFRKVIKNLIGSVDYAVKKKILDKTKLVLVDNSPGKNYSSVIEDLIESSSSLEFKSIAPAYNLGFGKGHNLVFDSVRSSFYLVLNPDVIVNNETIGEAVDYMWNHNRAGMISPQSHSPSGEKQYLCKEFPTVMDLFIRGFLPDLIYRLFKNRIDKYEMRGLTEDTTTDDIKIASGCFMFIRQDALKNISGFSPEYFLYFEDFDFSKKIRDSGWNIAYVPSVSIIHCGGNASKKGVRHIILFITSAIRFFNSHGWKIW